jgi:hypothetical protein
VALLVLAVGVFLAGMALIVWWFVERSARQLTAPAAGHDGSLADTGEMVPGPGLSPETVAHFARRCCAAPDPLPGISRTRG